MRHLEGKIFRLIKNLFHTKRWIGKKDNIERDKEERNEPSKSQCETKNGSACRYFDLVCPTKGKKKGQKEISAHKQQTHRGNKRERSTPGGRTGATFLIFEPRKGANSW